MKLRFTKMQGAGNDFVVIDAIHQAIEMTPQLARRLADRHFGVGCDQILLVERSDSADADFRYRIFNADGSEVEQCGNGARCFVRFVHDRGLSAKKEMRVRTLCGVITLCLEASGEVTVNMGVPVFEPALIPFVTPNVAPLYTIELEGRPLSVSVLSMGNPHAVQVVEDAESAPVTQQGPLLEHHERFPRRVNAGYMQVLDEHRIKLRVWERGAGETLACGTGACAAVVAGIRRGLLRSPVKVAMRGGELTLRWPGDGNDLNCAVWMTGPAAAVFEGEIETDGR